MATGSPVRGFRPLPRRAISGVERAEPGDSHHVVPCERVADGREHGADRSARRRPWRATSSRATWAVSSALFMS